MQSTQFTGELGRLRAEELARRPEGYIELGRGRRQPGGIFARPSALVVLGLSFVVLLATAGIAFAAEDGGRTPERSASARGSGDLDLTPAVISVLVLVGVGLAAEVKRQIDRTD
jgi:hypothetical protein